MDRKFSMGFLRWVFYDTVFLPPENNSTYCKLNILFVAISIPYGQ